MMTPRLTHPYSELADAVAAGVLGTVVFARFTRFGPPLEDGADLTLDEIVMTQLLEDIGHAVRIAGPVERVHARFTSGPTTLPAISQLAMSHRGGAISHIVATWVPAPESRTTYQVTGTTGSLVHDSAASASIRTRWTSAPRQPDRTAGVDAATRAALVERSMHPEARTVAEAAARSVATGRAVLINPQASTEAGAS
jgi:predicted dehydrogenase